MKACSRCGCDTSLRHVGRTLLVSRHNGRRPANRRARDRVRGNWLRLLVLCDRALSRASATLWNAAVSTRVTLVLEELAKTRPNFCQQAVARSVSGRELHAHFHELLADAGRLLRERRRSAHPLRLIHAELEQSQLRPATPLGALAVASVVGGAL